MIKDNKSFSKPKTDKHEAMLVNIYHIHLGQLGPMTINAFQQIVRDHTSDKKRRDDLFDAHFVKVSEITEVNEKKYMWSNVELMRDFANDKKILMNANIKIEESTFDKLVDQLKASLLLINYHKKNDVLSEYKISAVKNCLPLYTEIFNFIYHQ